MTLRESTDDLHSDASGSERKTVSYHIATPCQLRASNLTFTQADETATAILKKKKKPNSLM
jgi:hypothetical protein